LHDLSEQESREETQRHALPKHMPRTSYFEWVMSCLAGDGSP
jgi:hypothetical protein